MESVSANFEEYIPSRKVFILELSRTLVIEMCKSRGKALDDSPSAAHLVATKLADLLGMDA